MESTSDVEHDRLLCFKLNEKREDGETLVEKLCKSKDFDMSTLLKEMGDNVPQEQKDEIEGIEFNSTAVRKLVYFAGMDMLKEGWSRKFLQALDQSLPDKILRKQIETNQDDMSNYKNKHGIPNGSLLDLVRTVLNDSSKILVSPMGKDDELKEVPIIHPVMCESDNHYSGKHKAIPNTKYQLSDEIKQVFINKHNISFTDITRTEQQNSSSRLQTKHNLFLGLIGPAGSGKTCLTKRIVTTCTKDKKMVFLISLNRMDKSDDLSVKDLLFKVPMKAHGEETPSDEDIDISFQWVLHNQEKCFIILDGYDQSNFEIAPPPVQESELADDEDQMKPMKPSQLMGKLLTRSLLPNVRLILTSRPHKILHFPDSIRPDMVIYVKDLEMEGVKNLLKHYAPDSKVLEEDSSSTNRQLLRNPLYLRLFCSLNDEKGCDQVSSYTQTTAKLINELLERYGASAHYAATNRGLEELLSNLGHLAYDAIKDGRVVITEEDMNTHKLSADDVEDFMVAFVAQGRVKSKEFIFQHLVVQEFLAVRHIIEKMESKDFDNKLKRELFPKISFDEYNGKATVVDNPLIKLRPLVLGWFNQEKAGRDGDDVKEKKDKFYKHLHDHLQDLFCKNLLDEEQVKKHQKRMIRDMTQIRGGDVTKEMKANLADKCKFWFGNHFYQFKIDRSEVKNFLYFVKHFVTTTKYLRVDLSDWSETEIDEFFKTIKSLDGGRKIGRALVILAVGSGKKDEGRRKSERESRIDDIIEMLDHIKHELMIQYSGSFPNNQKEFQALQKSVKEYKMADNKQTEKLEFVLTWSKGKCRLFQVHFHPGKKGKVVGYYRDAKSKDNSD